MRARGGSRKAPFRAARLAARRQETRRVSAMIYARPRDMIPRYPNRNLVQLTNEDPTQTAANQAVLQQALADASAEIDGYLESRFRLTRGSLSAAPAQQTWSVA